jgi:tetratricopeptide (TPR) repeat protein
MFVNKFQCLVIKPLMKKSLLIFGLLLLSFSTFSQKVDLDELPIVASYVQLPLNPLPTELTTYSCDFTPVGFTLQQLGYSVQSLRSTYFTVSGFRKVETGGHFVIKVQIDLPQVEDVKEVNKTETVKDKDGKETKRTTYAYSFKYYVPARYVITDYKQNILQEGAMADGQRALLHTTDYVATQAQNQENWKRNRDAILTERSQAHLSQTLSAFQNRLNNDFGYVPRQRIKNNLWVLNGAKHPEYDVYQQHYQLIKTAFDRMTPEVGLDAVALKPALDYLEALPARFAADEKADRKLRYSAYYNLGWIYYWLDDFDRAIENADRLIKNDYDKRDGEGLKETVNAVKTRMAANRMTSRHLVRDVSNATAPPIPVAILAQQEAEAAEAKARRNAESMAQFNAIKGKIDDLYESMKKREEQVRAQIKTHDSLLVKEPQNAKLYYDRAMLKQIVGDGTAVADLEKAVSLKPKDVNYLRNLGQAGLRFRAYDKSLNAYDQALLLLPKNAELIHGRGVALTGAMRYTEAILAQTQALAINPKLIEALNERAFAYDYLGQYDAALDDFTKATKLNPKNPEARFGVAFIKTATGHYEESLADYAEAIKLRQFHPRAYGNRAYALGSLGRVDEAKKDIATALQQDSRYANGYYIRAWLRAREKNYQGALEDGRKALALGHTKPYKVHTIMGDALLGLGIASEATKQYDEALKIQPNYAEALVGKRKTTDVAAN